MPRKRDIENISERKRLGYGEIMSPDEIDTIISKALSLNYMGLPGVAWSCLFAVFWAFGKRVSEIVELRTTDITVRGNDLAVTFTIRKKVRKSKNGIPIPEDKWGTPPRRTKRLTLDNKYAQIIRDYWESIKVPGGFMFPGIRSKHINSRYVWDAIKLMGFEQPIWSHLFRHTLATELAQNEVGAFEMKSWFDWEKIDTADSYVSAAGVSTKKASGRKW